MRPKIMPSRKIAQSLAYNENKVTQGKAECIASANFLKETPRLTVEDKLRRFERRLELNDRVSTSLHITLNFDPQDKLSNEQMKKITAVYMKEIGFERQPYLVYRHHDAGHPHCHIVTTHVQKNGDPIDLTYIGKYRSEAARKKIEAEFHLVTAEMKQQQRQQQRQQRQQIDGVPRITYGEGSVTRAMDNVLQMVRRDFHPASVTELNAILRLYNMEAYTGREGTRLHQNHGLLYRVLDENGHYIGRPVKASFFDFKPTLDNWEQKFALNQHHPLRQESRQHINRCASLNADWYGDSLENFRDHMFRDNIHPVLRFDRKGLCTGAAYVDFQNKCAFDSSQLKEECSPAAIRRIIENERLAEAQRLVQEQTLGHRHRRGLRL